MANLFKKFDIKKLKGKKPPSNNSFDTDQEIKHIAKIPINKKFIKDKDDVYGSFKKTAKENNVEFPSKQVGRLIDDSREVISKLKMHFNRPRPKVLAKKRGMKLENIMLKSMDTPSYPSGHSTQGILVAKYMCDMYPNKSKQFMKTGKDISNSRLSARCHYPSDSKFGEKLGEEMYKHVKNKI